MKFGFVAPNLSEDLRRAQMDVKPGRFMRLALILAAVMAFNFSIPVAIILRDAILLTIPAYFVLFLAFYFAFLHIPRYNSNRVRYEIESDIFIPSRMFLTLLEAGNSIVSALEGVSYTRAKSSKYFGKIASEIYLGKNIDKAIDDAIRFTPSESFRRVLEPIRNSLRTGTDIQKNLAQTLDELAQEKVVEIEKYERKLGALSLFYMLFGTIIPAVGVVILIIGMSIIGLEVQFFPFLFILLLLILMLPLAFIRLFRGIRPLMNL